MKSAPKILLDTINVTDNHYTCNGNVYDVANLIQYTKELKLEPFELPIAAIDLTTNPFDVTNIKNFAEHVLRVKNTDYKYPIILDDTGYIADGWHRVAKALLDGKTTLQAVRLQKMPRPSNVNATNK